MKIRNGFVSNSSSSSFTFNIDNKENKDRILQIIKDIVEVHNIEPKIREKLYLKEIYNSEYIISGDRDIVFVISNLLTSVFNIAIIEDYNED